MPDKAGNVLLPRRVLHLLAQGTHRVHEELFAIRKGERKDIHEVGQQGFVVIPVAWHLARVESKTHTLRGNADLCGAALARSLVHDMTS